MIDLRRLRAFVVVAEEGHVTRAAERLGTQQPPLSRLIRSIEADLATLLLRRSARGVSLTSAGEVLLAQARATLAAAEAIPEAVRRAARGETGSLAVGFTSSAAFHPTVLTRLRRFREAAPEVNLRLEEAGTGELAAGLADGRLDAAFIRSSIVDGAGLRVDDLGEEPMIAALPGAHPLARTPAGNLPLASLAHDDFVLYRRPTGPGLYDAILGACLAAGFNPRVVQEAPRLTATLALVAAGLGISLVPASLERLALEGIVYRSLGPDGPRAPLRLASLRSASAVLIRFRGLVLGDESGEALVAADRAPHHMS
jgi:DNA-binding transcriptional LysR family regulator